MGHGTRPVEVDDVRVFHTVVEAARLEAQALGLTIGADGGVDLAAEGDQRDRYVVVEGEPVQEGADVAVFEAAHHGHASAVHRAALPRDGVEVGKGLGGVVVEAAAVDDGNGVDGAGALDDALAAAAQHDDVEAQAGEYLDHVVDVARGLDREELRGVLCLVGRASKQAEGALEGSPRDEAGLVEEAVKGLAFKGGQAVAVLEPIGALEDGLLGPSAVELRGGGEVKVLRHGVLGVLEWRPIGKRPPVYHHGRGGDEALSAFASLRPSLSLAPRGDLCVTRRAGFSKVARPPPPPRPHPNPLPAGEGVRPCAASLSQGQRAAFFPSTEFCKGLQRGRGRRLEGRRGSL